MYAVVIEHDPQTETYAATSPDIGDNVVGIGTSEDDAVARFKNALLGYLDTLRAEGRPLPEPRYTVARIAV
jgi:predicted RNase H-like HicB family nuclease